ncbi:hypothetical protein BU25DRAFT_161059 [Macroventuria anomochaeta]|uniref:Uncharacterized protein n=1 Tax=Macroventuria anomochaeta TaxID=301207 RepID=A0ACB6RR24_9PLEO|nr:uncharacterized protein BU25DRAFT_161059 [Macroventuria anomochaeta]KAF2624425.1 hypothetical protein BU25DRAFT_161059 [Macroventuria anomochaeta]
MIFHTAAHLPCRFHPFSSYPEVRLMTVLLHTAYQHQAKPVASSSECRKNRLRISLNAPNVRPRYLGRRFLPEDQKLSVQFSRSCFRSTGTSLQRLSNAALSGSFVLAPHHSCRGRAYFCMEQPARCLLGTNTSDSMYYCRITHDICWRSGVASASEHDRLYVVDLHDLSCAPRLG